MNAIAEVTQNAICITAAQSAVQEAAEAARTLALPVAEDAKELALAITVDDDSTLAYAGEELTKIAGANKRLDALRKSFTKPLDDGKAEIMNLFRPAADMLGEAERLLRSAVGGYQTRKAREAQEARARAEAKARAEREQAEREAREAQQRAAELEKSADAEQAAAARAKAEEAAEKAELAAVAPPPVLAVTEAPKVSGISSREVWKFEITDLAALVKAAAERPELIGYLQVDEKALGATVRGMKGKTQIPGVRVYAEQATAVRSR